MASIHQGEHVAVHIRSNSIGQIYNRLNKPNKNPNTNHNRTPTGNSPLPEQYCWYRCSTGYIAIYKLYSHLFTIYRVMDHVYATYTI